MRERERIERGGREREEGGKGKRKAREREREREREYPGSTFARNGQNHFRYPKVKK